MLAHFIGWILTYKYFVLFPAALLEGPIITIIAGSFCASGQLDFLTAYAVIVTGDVTADSLYYALGRFGRTRFLNRWGHRVGLDAKRVQYIDRHFLRHAAKTLILGKLAFSFEIPVIVSAGIAQFSYARFLVYMIIATLPKTLTLLLIGYFFGYSVTNTHRDLVYASRAIGGLVLVIILLLSVRYLRRSRSVKLESLTTTSDHA